MDAFMRCAVGLLSLGAVACSSSGPSTSHPSGMTGGASAGGGSGSAAGMPAAGGIGSAAAMPAAGAPTEVQLAMTAFAVPAGGEVFKCQDFDNPIGKDIALVSSESIMPKGSHHFAAFRMNNLVTAPMQDCPSGGLEAHEFIHASQQLDQVTAYPANVGRYLPASDGLRLMVHYLNAAGTPAHVDPTTFSMRYVDADKVQYKAAGVFLNNVGISVPPGQSSVKKSWVLPSDIHLLVAVSHMHEHAVGFTSNAGDGRMIYQTTLWNEPQATSFDPPMDIASGTSIAWTCNFQNDTGQTLVFGQSASKNEMCIFNGVYYPSPDGASIVQNL
jgi:hypothetical protein